MPHIPAGIRAMQDTSVPEAPQVHLLHSILLAPPQGIFFTAQGVVCTPICSAPQSVHYARGPTQVRPPFFHAWCSTQALAVPFFWNGHTSNHACFSKCCAGGLSTNSRRGRMLLQGKQGKRQIPALQSVPFTWAITGSSLPALQSPPMTI